MGPPYPDWASDGSVPYGMCAALDRLTTGLAGELLGTGVSVNALGTSGLVLTPGVAVVSPHTPENASVEPGTAMADAAGPAVQRARRHDDGPDRLQRGTARPAVA